MINQKLWISLSREPQKVIAVTSCIIMAILFGWQLLHLLKANEGVSSSTIAMPPPKQPLEINSQSSIFRQPLFGRYIVLPLNEPKPSNLAIQLVGIIYTGNEKSDHVLVQIDNGGQIYHIDDTLPGGAILKKITPTGILVLYNGSLESLSLPKNELLFDKPAAPLIKE